MKIEKSHHVVECCRSESGGHLASLASTAQIGLKQIADLKSVISFILDQSKNTDQTAGSRDDKCSICLCDFTAKITLIKCGHSFCAGCTDEAFKHQKKCPVCSQVYGPLIGNQPPGLMMINRYLPLSLPGLELGGTIVISYTFPSGTQGPDDPNPGKPYTETSRDAYLPNNPEGRKVLNLLKQAFAQGLTFTIGRSTKTGRDCVVWNDIPHKTSIYAGPAKYVYFFCLNDLFVDKLEHVYALLYFVCNIKPGNRNHDQSTIKKNKVKNKFRKDKTS